jgi:hypothetical protein
VESRPDVTASTRRDATPAVAGPVGPVEFVQELPDLIEPCEYAAHPDGALVRLRIRATADGVELLGDALRPAALELLLASLGGGPMEQMLCG